MRTHRMTAELQRSKPSAAQTAGIALFLLTSLNLFNFIDRYVLPGVQPLVQKEFNVNDAQIGLLTSAFFFTYMIAAPLTGWLGDRFPRRPLIVAGTLLWSIATLFTATVHSYDTLLFRHAIVGIGEATFSIYAPALLADFYPEIDRNRVLSIFYITIPVGAALGYLMGGVLGQHYGWRAPFFIAALPGVLIAAAFWFFIKEPERGAADELAPTFNRATIAGFARNPAFWTATLGMAMWTFTVGGISTFLPTFFVRFAGYSVALAGITTGAITAICGLLGTVAGGWLGNRWLRKDHRALYFISAWSMLIAIPAAAAAVFGPRSLLIPAVFLAEFLLFLNNGPLNACIVNSVAAPIRATALAVNLFMIHGLGDAFSPRLIGHISDRTNSLRIGLGATLVSLAIASIILFTGSHFAPLLPESEDTHELSAIH